MNNDLSMSENYSFFNKVKGFIQVHIIAKDRGFKYEPIANTPEFNQAEDALKYWKYNRKSIEDSNFYKDPIVLVRREIHSVTEEELG